MLFERIESKGLAHYSYLLGDSTQALVIDPRRDVDVYVQKAIQAGLRIRYIMETHRNEDYIVGSLELAARTGAEIWHADAQWDYQYGQAAADGQTWKLDRLTLQAIHSPGHTPGSMSYLLRDHTGAPWALFSGDALFAGDVGRVDFMGTDQLENMAGQLYDTIFHKFLPLGDGILLCPAHGAGSVCGSGIADRVWTTLGLELQINPRLQHDSRASFIAEVGRDMEKVPYFAQMEQQNLAGPALLHNLPLPPRLTAEEFARQAQEALVLDTRLELGFASAHVPGALSIWLEGVPSFGGWFLPYDRPLLLVNETGDPTRAVRYLIRMGYDNLAGTLAGGMLAWHTAGYKSASIPTVTVQQLCHLLDEHGEPWILDVRSEQEVAQNEIPEAHNIHLTQLPQRKNEVPRDRPVYVFCGSGLRAMIGASLLRQKGWDNATVVLGGLAGWSSHSCPLDLE
ncbi:MAG: MBL fold metallo-hydrolase [Chloroflexia bacterium]|nr:MBL fold metallo-hydrolase [Chloroflexia bacterium]